MSTSDPARTLAAHLPDAPPGARVTLMGHVHRRRELAKVSFLIVRDRSGLAQVVLRPEEVPTDGLPVRRPSCASTARRRRTRTPPVASR
ncbi:OB-fold nucleic acid binding domain-containing protein [Microbacterium sp. NPDC028030]|uniref:OB-fold nucleic acid binding domain-containing protein n=1 Tax=Microbacterium sp. NPDC028030 TaxID=3155124 RepID=UPI0033CCCE59